MKIVGINFRSQGSRKLLKESPEGTVVVLKRDPMNPYDSNAVKAFLFKAEKEDGEYTFTCVGFVNREAAAELSTDWPITALVGYALLKPKNNIEFKGFLTKEELIAILGATEEQQPNE
jgi:hypothetical protein